MKLMLGGNKENMSLYIYKSVWTNGTCKNIPYKTLGSMKKLCEELGTDEGGVMAWAREQVEIENEAERKEKEKRSVRIELNANARIPKDKARSFECGYLFLQSIFYALKPEDICQAVRSGKHRNDKSNKTPYRYKYDLCRILADLVYTRILYPASKRSSYENAQKFVLHENYEEHDLYNALIVLGDNSDYIQEQVYKNSHFLGKRDKRILYYDVTNFYFEIEEAKGMRQFGFSKEHRPNPTVQMGMFVDTDGLPLAFSIFDGNQNENTSLKPLEDEILKNFGCEKFVYCCDAGLASESNRVLNSVNDRHFVVTQSLKKLNAEERAQAIDVKGFKYLRNNRPYEKKTLAESDETLYKEVTYTSDNLWQRMLVYYSPEYAVYSKALRCSRLDRAQKNIDKGAYRGKLHNNRSSVDRYVNEFFCDEDGVMHYDAMFGINEDLVRSDAELDGLYAVCTDMYDETPERILAITKGRWQIEADFRLLKLQFKARPVWVYRDECIKGHFLTCYLALLVFRLLEKKLHYKYTPDEIIGNLKDMHILATADNYGNPGFEPNYTRNDFTDDVHELCGINTDFEFMYQSDMNKTISKTKDADCKNLYC